MIYAKVYGCVRMHMHIDCRLGSAIFVKIVYSLAKI